MIKDILAAAKEIGASENVIREFKNLYKVVANHFHPWIVIPSIHYHILTIHVHPKIRVEVNATEKTLNILYPARCHNLKVIHDGEFGIAANDVIQVLQFALQCEPIYQQHEHTMQMKLS